MSATAIKRVPVVSSNIASAGYDSGTLSIEFLNGSVWDYPNVPAEIFTDFMASESKGKYFASHIRNKYVGVKQ